MSTSIAMTARESGGLVAEDVLPKLFNISKVDRPFIDSIGRTSASNVKKEFTDKTLAAASSTNTMYENQDLSSVADNSYGLRYYNLCQPLVKVIKMSQRGRDVKTTYDEDEYLKQLMDAADELRRDEEAAAVSRNAATAEVAGASGALMAGVSTWAIRNTQRGAGGADAVLDGTTGAGGGPTTAPTDGTARAMTETMLRTALRSGWEDGAEFDYLMSTGDMIETIANYMFTSTARVATMQSTVQQSNTRTASDGNGARSGGITAQGAVNMFVGNFGTVTLVPNRFMSTYDVEEAGTDMVDVILYDSRYPVMAYLHDYDRQMISANGLYEQEALWVDSCLIPDSTYSITTIADINPAVAMTA